MYRYEPHLHTWPSSRCGNVCAAYSIRAYKDLGYDGVFLTNHLRGGMNDPLKYANMVDALVQDYREARTFGERWGVKVFFGFEYEYKPIRGTHFLVYGLSEDWLCSHKELNEMPSGEALAFLAEEGGMVVQAHPFREFKKSDHLCLYPRLVQAVEVCNSTDKPWCGPLAEAYADAYDLPGTAGSDNHWGPGKRNLAGVETETPLESCRDYIDRVLAREVRIFRLTMPDSLYLRYVEK